MEEKEDITKMHKCGVVQVRKPCEKIIKNNEKMAQNTCI